MKAIVLSEELTTEIYFMMIHIENIYKKELEKDKQYLLQGIITKDELDKSKVRYALAKEMLDITRRAKSLYIDELPF